MFVRLMALLTDFLKFIYFYLFIFFNAHVKIQMQDLI